LEPIQSSFFQPNMRRVGANPKIRVGANPTHPTLNQTDGKR